MNFIWSISKVEKVDKFCKFVLLYKKKYGHANIKNGDKIDGYNIGTAYAHLRQDYKSSKLTDEEIKKSKMLVLIYLRIKLIHNLKKK